MIVLLLTAQQHLTLTLNTNLRFAFFRQILMDYSSSSSLPYVEEKTEVIYGGEVKFTSPDDSSAILVGVFNHLLSNETTLSMQDLSKLLL